MTRRPLFPCPDCGGEQRVLNDRRFRAREIGGFVWRARQCRECGTQHVYRESQAGVCDSLAILQTARSA